MTGSSGQAHLFYRLRSSYSQPIDIISRSVRSFECVVTNRLRNFGNRRSKWNLNDEPTPSSTTNDTDFNMVSTPILMPKAVVWSPVSSCVPQV